MNSVGMTVTKVDCHLCKFLLCASVNAKYKDTNLMTWLKAFRCMQC